MSDLPATIVTVLTTSIYDPRAWLALFLGFALGYGHGLRRWWVVLLAFVVAIAADATIRVYAPSWAVPTQPERVAGWLVFLGIPILGYVGYVAGHSLESWLARRRARRP
jgi:hypothetical protein